MHCALQLTAARRAIAPIHRLSVRYSTLAVLCLAHMSTKLLASALLLSLHMVARPLAAECPRTGGEKAQRIVPAIMLFPYGLFMLLHGQSHVPMPEIGAHVRVSHDSPDGLRFSEGTLLASSDSAFQLLIADRDTSTFPRATARCLQVYRNSRLSGAGIGLAVGVWTGFIGGIVAGIRNGGGWDVFADAFLGAFVGMVAGPLVGAAHGAAAWDIAWERPK